jgi:hypothetical protein
MSRSLDAIFRDVVAHPTDMAPRREYAAVVGGERGELITAQLATDESLKAGGPAVGIGREGALLLDKARAQQWAQPLLAEAGMLTFMRGFVEHVEVDALWFVANYQQLFESAPVRHLDVSGLVDEHACSAFFDCQGLEQIAGLAFLRPVHESVFAAVAASKRLGMLRYLSLQALSFSDEDLLAILRALPSLCTLRSHEICETPQFEWDGKLLFVDQSERLKFFESKHGLFHAFHEVERLYGQSPSRQRY